MLEQNSMLDKFGLELFVDKAPPHITELFGYTGYRRWVAFSWGQEDGFLRFHDGYSSGPANQLAWDAFFNHPLVMSLNNTRAQGCPQKRFEFGDAFIPPNHWLLSDCQSRRMYAGPQVAVLGFLGVFLSQLSEKHKNKSMCQSQLGRSAHDCPPRGGRGLEKINAMLNWLDCRLEQGRKTATRRGPAPGSGFRPEVIVQAKR